MGIIILMKFLDIPSRIFYAGANLNYYSWSSKQNGNSYNYDGADNFGLGLQVGGRYFFNEILE
jgi:hypothetical protein